MEQVEDGSLAALLEKFPDDIIDNVFMFLSPSTLFPLVYSSRFSYNAQKRLFKTVLLYTFKKPDHVELMARNSFVMQIESIRNYSDALCASIHRFVKYVLFVMHDNERSLFELINNKQYLSKIIPCSAIIQFQVNKVLFQDLSFMQNISEFFLKDSFYHALLKNNVKILHLNESKFNFAELPLIKIFQSLKVLKLMNSSITDEQFESILSLKSVVDIDLSGNLITNPTLFLSFENLEVLNLDYNCIKTVNLVNGNGGNYANKLRHLSFAFNLIDKIENLCGFPNLSFLDLNGNDLPVIEQIHSLPKLKIMYVNQNPFVQFGKNVFKNVFELNLSSNRFSDFQKVADIIRNFPGLKQLILYENSLAEFYFAKEFDELSLLDLSLCQIKTLVLPTVPFHRLKSLNLFNNKLETIENSFTSLPNLTEIILSRNTRLNIDALIKDIAGLKFLKILYLSDVPLKDLSCFRHFTQSSKLTELHLNNVGISKIEYLDNLQNLRVLYLQKNRIFVIENLEKLKSLTKLFLDNNRITQTTKFYTKLPNLSYVSLSNNSINQSDIEYPMFV